MIKQILVFLLLNFAALGLGSYFTSDGVISDWYVNLNKAPWTPPGWFFGVAWTTIMILFSVFMAAVWTKETNKNMVIGLYALQWMLNVGWNPVFFGWHYAGLGLLVITCLLILIGYLFFRFKEKINTYAYFILPYLLWMIVATSLNAYAYFMN